MPQRMKLLQLATLAALALLSGCADMKVKVWPFGGDKTVQERPRSPANATEYQCAGGKRIFLRKLDGGEAIWLILPERELRLDRIGADGTRYGRGAMVLQLAGSEATLTDGATAPVSGCRTGIVEPAPSGESVNN